MIYLIFGQDTYRMRQSIKELTKKSEADLYKLDLEEDGFPKVRLLAGYGSLFSRKKLLVVGKANIIQSRELSDFISSFQNHEDTIVFWDEKIDEEKFQIFKRLNSKIQEFKSLTGVHLKNWIAEEAKKRGLRLFPAHWEKLAVCGSDTWALSGELDKMTVEGYGTSPGLASEHLEAKPGLGRITCFSLGDSFFTSRKQGINDLLQLSQQGEDEFGLFNYLANHCRTVLLVKYYIEKKQLVLAAHKIHPFVVKKTTAISRNLSLDQLIYKFKNFFEEDFKIKTGQTMPVGSLTRILLNG